MHDVVEVCEEVGVGRHILPPLHDLADQLVGMKLPLLIAIRQHGGLGRNTHTDGLLQLMMCVCVCHVSSAVRWFIYLLEGTGAVCCIAMGTQTYLEEPGQIGRASCRDRV